MGRGAIVIGLAAVIIGEVLVRALFKRYINFSILLAFTVLGGVLYYLVVVVVLWLKLDYFSLMGLLSGSMTDPPALAYATSQSSQNDNAAVAYSTVYPLTMFLRVLTAQVMIMVLL